MCCASALIISLKTLIFPAVIMSIADLLLSRVSLILFFFCIIFCSESILMLLSFCIWEIISETSFCIVSSVTSGINTTL